jgi:hypothetical protein
MIHHELANLYQPGELLPVKYRFLNITPSLLSAYAAITFQGGSANGTKGKGQHRAHFD